MGLEGKATAGKAGEGHAEHACDDAVMKAVAGVLGFAGSLLDPACAAAFLVGCGEVLFGEGLAGAQEFEDGFA